MRKLLVIDDEESIIRTIQIYFEEKGFVVKGARNATEMQEQLPQNPDIIFLDIMMPGIDGISLCRQIRKQVLCPILFLSAKIDENSKIKGFSAGGDDYITKPFSMEELYARVEAHIRRESRIRNPINRILFGALWIDYGRMEVGTGTNVIAFSKKEYMIVELLSSNAGQVFSQNRIYEGVWGYDADGDANTSVMEHIKRIRKKLREYSKEEYIGTVWGIGYKWML